VDYDPAMTNDQNVTKIRAAKIRDYNSIIKTHMDIVCSDRPEKPNWNPGAGTLAEDLEALRVYMGYGAYMGDKSFLSKGLAMPLFLRFPLAEQVVWNGLNALINGDIAQARTLLKNATIKYNYKRAAILLATHLLEHKQISEAEHYLNFVNNNQKNNKVKLLKAYITACKGQINNAFNQFKQLIENHKQRAHYALGNIYLYSAGQARKTGDKNKVDFYNRQALKAFSVALKSHKNKMPRDCEILSQSAAFIVDPEHNTESMAQFFDRALEMNNDNANMWIKWNILIAQLWNDPLQRADELCREIGMLLDNAENIPQASVLGIAQTASLACIDCENIDQANTFIKLIGSMIANSDDRSIRGHYQQALTAGLRIRYLNASDEDTESVRQDILRTFQKDPGNIWLILLGLHACLEICDKSTAMSLLQNADPQDDYDEWLCMSLYHLLRGETIGDKSQLDITNEHPFAMKEGIYLLRIMDSFIAGDLDKGYDGLLDVLRVAPDILVLHEVINIRRILPCLCGRLKKGAVIPPYLVEEIRKIIYNGDSDKHALTIARCAVAVGLKDDACSLLEKLLETKSDSNLSNELVSLLCHLSVEQYKSEQYSKAASLIQKAAKYTRIR